MSKHRAIGQMTASPFELLVQLIRDLDIDNQAGEEVVETLVSTSLAILVYYVWTVAFCNPPFLEHGHIHIPQLCSIRSRL